ncbi:hypothetical protein DZS_13100 [Dickeya ananatis]
MQNAVQDKAYQRGLKAASIWKNAKSNLMRWDVKCVDWATRHHIPKWVGHMPVITGIVLFLSGVFLGGIVFSVIMLFVAAFASVMFGSASTVTTDNASNTNNNVFSDDLFVSKSPENSDVYDLDHPYNDPHYNGCPYGDKVEDYNTCRNDGYTGV